MILSVCLFWCGRTSAQNPVDWKFNVTYVGDSRYEVTITAVIQDGWYIYSKDNGNSGPMPTTVHFDSSSVVELIGMLEEEGDKRIRFDPLFNSELEYYKDQAIFKQRFRLLATRDIILKGKVVYMGCDDHMCLPPQSKSFEVPIRFRR